MSVERICHLEVHVADADESTAIAAQRMRQKRVGTLVVVDESERPVGLLTDRDLVARVMAMGRDPKETRVLDVMTKSPKTMLATAPIEEALALMKNGGFRRIPIVSPKGKLVGLVSLDDVLLFVATEFSWIGELLGKKLPRRGGGATTTVSGRKRTVATAAAGARPSDR